VAADARRNSLNLRRNRGEIMRTFIISVLAWAVISGLPARAQEATKEAKIEKILTLTKSESMMDRMFAQMKVAMPSQSGSKSQEVQDKFLDSLKTLWTRLRPQYVKLYAETFSDEEIDGMLAFYQSPAGHAVIDKMPDLMTKFMVLMMPEIQRITKEAQQP
jgi:hypothetical protein